METVPIVNLDGSNGWRVECDSLGEVSVPVDALYGANAVRGVANFRVSGLTCSERPELVSALGHVKAASARANVELGVLSDRLGEAIVAAAREVAAGDHLGQFPIDVVHGGGGTALNMNMNEVIANRAAQLLGGRLGTYDLVHPNDHVNRSQSTNDVIPTALAMATHATGMKTLERVAGLAAALETKGEQYGDTQRLGRTCLRDAVSLTIRETHRGQAYAIRRTADALRRSLGELLDVPLGGTILGTGSGTPAGYARRVIELLGEESDLDVRAAVDPFDSFANIDGYVDVAAQMVRVGMAVAKIASDLRFLSSGPEAGIGEVILPAVQVGSSIMPGKVNPAIPELVMQVGFELGGTLSVVCAAVAGGELELNVMEPVIARHLLGGLHDLGAVSEVFAARCVAHLEWDLAVVAEHLAASFEGAVEAAAEQGYSAVAATHLQAGYRVTETDT